MSTNLVPQGDGGASADVLDIARQLATAFIYLDALDRRTLSSMDPTLTPAQYHALAALATQPGQSLSTLAVHLLCDKANASGLIDRLSAVGLARREKDPDDARRVALSLTPDGERALSTASALRGDALSRALTPIAELQSHLHDLVDALRLAVEDNASMGKTEEGNEH